MLLCSCGNTYDDRNDNDLSKLIGKNYEEAEKLLGESVSIISDNTRYYEQYGVSVVYDKNTNLIIYVDIDTENGPENVGEYCVNGIFCNMNRDDTLKQIDGLGFDEDNYSQDVWSVISDTSESKQEFSLQFEDDKVKVVTIKTIK